MTREVPDFGPGDTVVVEVKVKEGDRERVQAYEGVVIAKSNRGINSSFTVRKISHGEGVERVFQTLQPGPRCDHGEAPWQRPPRQAVLPARAHRQVGPHRREGLTRQGRAPMRAIRRVLHWIWAGLDGLRKILHLLLLLLIFA